MGGSLAFIYTSSYEGQGLPPIEAMTTGAPVLAFDNSAVREMVPPEMLVADPEVDDDEGFCKFPGKRLPQTTLDEVIDRLRELLIRNSWELASKAAVAHAGRFTAEAFDAPILAVYKNISGELR